MGFKSGSSAPSAQTTIPVVTDTVENDTERAYAQESSRKKGMLSTLLSARRKREESQNDTPGNKTLG